VQLELAPGLAPELGQELVPGQELVLGQELVRVLVPGQALVRVLVSGLALVRHIRQLSIHSSVPLP
jgi:hypothetical protein